MDVNDLLVETFDRLPDLVLEVVEGLTAEDLVWAPRPGANTIGWLVWHLTRVQDDHVAEVAGRAQVWASGEWAAGFGLTEAFRADPGDIGYGHTAEQMASVRPEGPEPLLAYYRAVSERTRTFVATLRPPDLDRIVDERWDPPVTLGVRLVSVANDDLQHVGQAAYLRGLLPAR